jgi:uncharacterized protein YdeI (YjbR/CyaY-like superfamily)
MPVKNIDEYIDGMQPFAIPVLVKLRKLVHKACPEVKESIKWGMPAFEHHGPLCNMAGFKQHCVFGFWKESLLKDPGGYLKPRAMKGGEAMGHFGRITSLKDLPPDKVIIDLIKQAAKLNEEGVKVVKKKDPAKAVKPPKILLDALAKSKKARLTFDSFSPSAQKEYIEWILDAKTDTTRDKRLATTIEWLEEGKRKNWKYEKKK